MPPLETRVDLNLKGERVQILTQPVDQITAERTLGHSPMETPIAQGMRVWWCALRRQHPGHPASSSFREFLDHLKGTKEYPPDDDFDYGDDTADETAATGNGAAVRPTLPVGGDG